MLILSRGYWTEVLRPTVAVVKAGLEVLGAAVWIAGFAALYLAVWAALVAGVIWILRLWGVVS